MDLLSEFSVRLRLALNVANLSPVALGAFVGADNSIVSRWLSGRSKPTQHNLARIADYLAERMPGFTILAFETHVAEFERLIGQGGTGHARCWCLGSLFRHAAAPTFWGHLSHQRCQPVRVQSHIHAIGTDVHPLDQKRHDAHLFGWEQVIP